MIGKLDSVLVLTTSFLVLMGVLIHWSISQDTFVTHLLYVLLGGLAFVGAWKLDLQVVRSLKLHWFIGICLLLMATYFVGSWSRGSRRWLDLGIIRFQPSELAKLIQIIILPDWLSSLDLFKLKHLIQILILIITPALLILIGPDLGTSLVLMFISGVMLFVAGLPWRYLVIGLVVVALVSPALWLGLEDYQRTRITTFLSPTADPLGSGYNAIQSQIAVGSGQIFGRGLGQGTQSKLQFLPEYRTDFAFASLAEELGFVGSLSVILAFSLLIGRLLFLSSQTKDSYNSLVLIGIAAMILFQASVNIGMNMGIMPVTGITLPFISAGGTSLLVSLASIGLACNVAGKYNSRSGIEIRGKAK